MAQDGMWLAYAMMGSLIAAEVCRFRRDGQGIIKSEKITDEDLLDSDITFLILPDQTQPA